MDGRRIGAVALAVLAALSLAVAAATLETVSEPGGGVGAGDRDGSGLGSDGSFSLGAPNASDATVDVGRLPRIVSRIALVVLVVLGLVGLYLFYEEHGVRGIVASALGMAGVLFLFWLLAAALGDLELAFDGTVGLFDEGPPSLPGGDLAGRATGTAPTTDPPTLLVALFGLVLLGAVAVAVRASDGDTGPDRPAPSDDGSSPDVAAVGRVAGRAADRIETDGAAENEIYRAWREMTGHLDVPNPRASTPAEFAAAAVEAGMAREDVAELTDLFEAVRYGDRAATEARERRALAALRRIETAYAAGDESDRSRTAARDGAEGADGTTATDTDATADGRGNGGAGD